MVFSNAEFRRRAGSVFGRLCTHQLGARQIILLRESGTAGDDFATAFRDWAKNEDLQITADVVFTAGQARDETTLNDLISKIRKPSNKPVIVLGTQYGETAAVLRAIRDNWGAFTAFGYSSVATESLPAQLSKYETDRHPAGYYTDGLLVAAPQLADTAGYAQTAFASRYKARFGTDPNPEAVRWYEAAGLILQAVRSRRLDGSDTAVDRHAVRDWLAARNRPEAAAAGVAGPIYFDADRDVQRGITVGEFYGGHLISAPIQLIPVTNPDAVPGWDKLTSSGAVIEEDGTRVVKTPVVYAGVDLNSLDNIDTRAGTFAADFFLWFRYPDGSSVFDPHQVEFPSASSGAQLGTEVWHRNKSGFTTVTYHVKGVFHAEYEFSRFPFDEQVLTIPIQVRNTTSYSLMLASGSPLRLDPRSGHSVVASKLWRLENTIFYRDVMAYESALGDVSSGNQGSAIEIDRLNAATSIKRDVFGFAVKNFLPLLCILVAVLIGYALAPDVINPRVSIGVTALLTTSVLYQKLSGDLPSVTYIIGMDYVFFAFFGICVLFLALTVVTYETHRAKQAKPTKWLNQGGAVATLVGLVVTLIFVWVRYWGQAA